MDDIDISSEHLNGYVVAFSRKTEKDWFCTAGCVFAKSENDIPKLLSAKYEAVVIRSIEKIDISEGTILYGSSWHVC